MSFKNWEFKKLSLEFKKIKIMRIINWRNFKFIWNLYIKYKIELKRINWLATRNPTLINKVLFPRYNIINQL